MRLAVSLEIWQVTFSHTCEAGANVPSLFPLLCCLCKKLAILLFAVSASFVTLMSTAGVPMGNPRPNTRRPSKSFSLPSTRPYMPGGDRLTAHAGATQLKTAKCSEVPNIISISDWELKGPTHCEQISLALRCSCWDDTRQYLYIRDNSSIEKNDTNGTTSCCAWCCGVRDNVSVVYNDRTPYGSTCRPSPFPWCCILHSGQPQFEVLHRGCMCCCVKVDCCCRGKQVVISPFEKRPFPCCCCKNRNGIFDNCFGACGPINGNPSVYTVFRPQPKNADAFVAAANQVMLRGAQEAMAVVLPSSVSPRPRSILKAPQPPPPRESDATRLMNLDDDDMMAELDEMLEAAGPVTETSEYARGEVMVRAAEEDAKRGKEAAEVAETEAAAAPAACRQAPLAGRAAAVGWEMDDWVAVARVMEDLQADLEGSAVLMVARAATKVARRKDRPVHDHGEGDLSETEPLGQRQCHILLRKAPPQKRTRLLRAALHGHCERGLRISKAAVRHVHATCFELRGHG